MKVEAEANPKAVHSSYLRFISYETAPEVV